MASIEALWAVHFQSDFGMAGDGVVVFETNRAYGGDSGWYYLGDYEANDGGLRGRIQVHHYGAELPTVFGHLPGNSFELDLAGKFDGENAIRAAGAVVGMPNLTMSLTFRRLADLPNPS